MYYFILLSHKQMANKDRKNKEKGIATLTQVLLKIKNVISFTNVTCTSHQYLFWILQHLNITSTISSCRI